MNEDIFPAPEQYSIPKDPKKIRQRIRQYEYALEKEKRSYGTYGDGYGKRFLLGPLYMIMGDLQGALRSFDWFETEFPDSSDDAPQLLCWSLALHQVGDNLEARLKLRQTMLANLYVIPRLLGIEVTRHDISHGSNLAEPGFLSWFPDEYWGLWSCSDRQWADVLWNANEFRDARNRYIEFGHALKDLRPGPERSRVIKQMSRLRQG